MLATVGFEYCFTIVHLSLKREQGDSDESSDADAAGELDRFHYHAPSKRQTPSPMNGRAASAMNESSGRFAVQRA